VHRRRTCADDRRGKRGQKLKSGLLPIASQVRMCGNSVCPPLAQAIARTLVFGLEMPAMEGAAD
jgi:site-specific DNA-cytosine methylase